MKGIQVDPRMQGAYHFCPHCNKQMLIEGMPNFCYECGGKLNWSNVKLYNEITSVSCPYEDTDNNCSWYRRSCGGSVTCDYINSTWARKYAGILVSFEKDKLLIENGWK